MFTSGLCCFWGYSEATQHCHFSLGSGKISITKSDTSATGRDDDLCDMGPGCVQVSSFLTSESPEIIGRGRNKKPHRSLEVPLIAPSYLWCLQLAANLELYVSFSGRKISSWFKCLYGKHSFVFPSAPWAPFDLSPVSHDKIIGRGKFFFLQPHKPSCTLS